jgi:hypothetical protein
MYLNLLFVTYDHNSKGAEDVCVMRGDEITSFWPCHHLILSTQQQNKCDYDDHTQTLHCNRTLQQASETINLFTFSTSIL